MNQEILKREHNNSKILPPVNKENNDNDNKA